MNYWDHLRSRRHYEHLADKAGTVSKLGWYVSAAAIAIPVIENDLIGYAGSMSQYSMIGLLAGLTAIGSHDVCRRFQQIAEEHQAEQTEQQKL